MTTNSNLYINVNSLNPLFHPEAKGLYRGDKVLLYGIAGSMKTTTCLTVAMNELALGKKVLYIDADYNGVKPLKLAQLYNDIYKANFDPEKFNSPKKFEQAIYAVWKGKGLDIVTFTRFSEINKYFITEVPKIKPADFPSVIIVDSITQYYRINVLADKGFDSAKNIAKLVDRICKYADEHSTSVIFTAQRVSEVNKALKADNVHHFREFVGGELLHHAMDYIIESKIKSGMVDRVFSSEPKHRLRGEETKVTTKHSDIGLLK